MIDRVEAVWAAFDWWERTALLALATTALGQSLFVIKYATRHWWDYRVGRALMGKSASFGVVLVLSVVATFYRLDEWVGTTAFITIDVFVWYQTWVLYTSPRHLEPSMTFAELSRAATAFGFQLIPLVSEPEEATE